MATVELKPAEMTLLSSAISLSSPNPSSLLLAPADSDGPLYLPYKTLVSTVSSMVFSEGEAQQLIEILTEKAGIVQDTWHTVGLPAPPGPLAAGYQPGGAEGRGGGTFQSGSS